MFSPARELFSYRPYWAKRFGTASVLPRTRAEMDALGWDACDVVLVTGDAYIDHPAFGMALVGRLLEAQGFRVGILSQPDWDSAEPFRELGQPALFFGVTAGNMDSLVNQFTSDKKPRSDDAYTPDAAPNRRPSRASIVYAQRCREAFPEVPIVLGGIEASLRRIAHYDYWSDKVRRSILIDSAADLLVYGNGERQIVEIAHRLGRREPIAQLTDIRGTAFRVRDRAALADFSEIDSTQVDIPGAVAPLPNPYDAPDHGAAAESGTRATPAAAAESGMVSAPKSAAESGMVSAPKSAAESGTWSALAGAADSSRPAAPGSTGGGIESALAAASGGHVVQLRRKGPRPERVRSVLRLPSFEAVRADPVLYAHASRVLHLEANPGNARALVQRHGATDIWVNPPALPLSTPEMDAVYELPYTRRPHPSYAKAKIPAYEMIKFSITITRGCFGGCSFCSITEHEGRIIQNRSETSVLREIEAVREDVPGFTGHITDLGGPTANMYRLACRSREIESACRKPSCVFPDICPNLETNHAPLIQLYRKARALPGIKKITIGSGVRYDLAVRSPEYVKELVTHHVGGYLKIAPEHVSEGPLTMMMKPGIGAYDRFKQLFDRYSREAGKEQYLIPYFIAAHPGTTDEDMLELALWLKRHGFRADQVQAFLPSPLASATTMYHTGKNPLRKVHRAGGDVATPKSPRQRRLHKAFIRWHDPDNWPLLREALMRMGRADLIGRGPSQLIPARQPLGWVDKTKPVEVPQARRHKHPRRGTALTQHTGLPPRRMR